jgi:hypothetical protein
MPPEDAGSIVVFQDRTWMADPKLGAFTVYVDGRRVGVAPVLGELVVPINPGPHRVRIRQWWFRSPAVEVVVETGAAVRLRGDIPMSVGVFGRMGRFLFAPSSALVLDPLGQPLGSSERTQAEATMATARKGLLWEGIISMVGLVLLATGLQGTPALAAVGVVVFVFGLVVGIVSVPRARRGSG